MIQMAARRNVPVVVVNGRISERAYGRYLWVSDLIRPVVGHVSLFLMQDEIGASRIRTIGVSENRVKILGSLKWDASIGARPSNDVIEELRKSLGINPDEIVVVGGSTHRQEESFLLESLSKIRSDSKDNVRMVIAPRHLERVDEVLSVASNMGFAAYKASDALSSKMSWQVLVVDSLGELLKYYGIATIVFVGGSLIKRGGQNPIEPASLGKPIIVGPSTENFPEIIQQLLTHNAIRQLKGPSELSGVMRELISNREEADLMGAKAQALVKHLSGISQKTLDALKGFLTATSLRA
jgi:3-deoxy-D-manno-octulosonic-acid transferase